MYGKKRVIRKHLRQMNADTISQTCVPRECVYSYRIFYLSIAKHKHPEISWPFKILNEFLLTFEFSEMKWNERNGQQIVKQERKYTVTNSNSWNVSREKQPFNVLKKKLILLLFQRLKFPIRFVYIPVVA